MRNKFDLKFAVLGAGNGGQAMAAHLSLQGYLVHLYDVDQNKIETLKKKKGICLEGAIEGTGFPELITTDISQALKEVDIIMVVTPAYSHKYVAKACAPYITKDQIVVLNPGSTFGAIEFASLLKDSNSETTVAETQTLIYTCRAKEIGLVKLYAIKQKVSVGVFPSNRTSKILEVLKCVFPQFVSAENVLETSLSNLHVIVHAAPILLNAARIESSKEPFKYYMEGITPSVGRFMEKVDQERIKLGEKIGISLDSTLEFYKKSYGVEGKSLYEVIQKNKAAYKDVFAPSSLDTRYIYEDIPYGIVPMISLAKLIKQEVPTMEIIFRLGSIMLDYDFKSKGRTLESLGLVDLGIEDLKTLVQKGYNWS